MKFNSQFGSVGMNWEPAHADHSIESVSAFFAFVEPLTPDGFDDAVVALREVAASQGLTDRRDLQEPVLQPLEEGRPMIVGQPMIPIGPLTMARRVSFRQTGGAD